MVHDELQCKLLKNKNAAPRTRTMTETTTTAVLSQLARIPRCPLDQSDDYIDENFSIEAHVDQLFASEVALITRICKDECLAEELEKIANKKHKLVTRFNRILYAYAKSMDPGDELPESGIPRPGKARPNYGSPRIWEQISRHPSTDSKEEQEIDQLALRSFVSELRRSCYDVTLTYAIEPHGQGAYIRQKLTVRV
jgi:hypothetical protein